MAKLWLINYSGLAQLSFPKVSAPSLGENVDTQMTYGCFNYRRLLNRLIN